MGSENQLSAAGGASSRAGQSTPSLEDESSLTPDSSETSARLIEVGWILAGQFAAADREAVEKARDQVLDALQHRLPSFDWQMPVIRREERLPDPQVEPAVLLNHALTERNINHWDFTLVITESDLRSYNKPTAMAVVSRALDAAIISTARIDPRAFEPTASHADRVNTMATRLTRMVLHALGHWNGLSHTDEPNNFMNGFEQLSDLDLSREWTENQVQQLNHSLVEIADLRLEEQQANDNVYPVTFYLRSAWINRRAIGTAIWQARPWEFPVRLSRLTIASISTMVVMLLTAEAWDVGASQPFTTAFFLPLLVVGITTAYVVGRQRLILRPVTRRLTEQTVTTNLTTVAIVAIGMFATLLSIFALASITTLVLFRHTLVERWAESVSGAVGMEHYLTLAAFVASIGLGVGALGASFEGQHYFQHVTFVDEEI